MYAYTYVRIFIVCMRGCMYVYIKINSRSLCVLTLEGAGQISLKEAKKFLIQFLVSILYL